MFHVASNRTVYNYHDKPFKCQKALAGAKTQCCGVQPHHHKVQKCHYSNKTKVVNGAR